MPSTDGLPSVEALRRAFLAEATLSASARGEVADTHPGSLYDHCAGMGAVLAQRVAARDRDEFRALYFASSDERGMDLLAEFVGRPRQQGSHGTGSAVVTRTSGTSGWFREGTRIAAGRSFAGPEFYSVTTDTWAAASDASLSLPIHRVRTGGAVQRIRAGDPGVLRWEDPIWDPSWSIDVLYCSAGVEREDDQALREALRTERQDGRLGYALAITDACRAAGATFVALFDSDYLGEAEDFGLTRVYVADSGEVASEELLRACRIAVAGAAIGGIALQVLPSQIVRLSVDLQVALSRDFNASAHLAADVVGAVVDYFSDAVLWRQSGITGAVFRALPGIVDRVTVVAPVTEPARALPSVLNRYVVTTHDVRVALLRAS